MDITSGFSAVPLVRTRSVWFIAVLVLISMLLTVNLAWLLTKATAPVVGATKLHHVDGAVKAAELSLNGEEIKYLEEPYIPHPLVGVMAQNNR